jgi:hypothetical protein
MYHTHTEQHRFLGMNLATFVLVALLLLTLFVYASSNSTDELKQHTQIEQYK